MTPNEALDYRDAIVLRLREERQRQGLSRRRVQLLGGPSEHCLKAMEAHRRGPTLLTAIRYADVLQLDVGLSDRGIKSGKDG